MRSLAERFLMTCESMFLGYFSFKVLLYSYVDEQKFFFSSEYCNYPPGPYIENAFLFIVSSFK